MLTFERKSFFNVNLRDFSYKFFLDSHMLYFFD